MKNKKPKHHSKKNGKKKTTLAQDINQLCKRCREGSIATQVARKQTLLLCANQLKEAGLEPKSLKGLKPKHIASLITRWKTDNLSTGTIKNRLSHLRKAVSIIGKGSIIPKSNDALGIERRATSQINKAEVLTYRHIQATSDPYIEMAMQLQVALGLRREEALKFNVNQADKDTHITLKASWCKGGRERVIPIRTEAQRKLLDQVHKIAGNGSLIPSHKTYIEQRRHYDYKIRQAGLNSSHGLRHRYAQRRYIELTGGMLPPKLRENLQYKLTKQQRLLDKEARLTISLELGHNRIDVTNAYLGFTPLRKITCTL